MTSTESKLFRSCGFYPGDLLTDGASAWMPLTSTSKE